MMETNKPRIYAFCKAGSEWETIHREEFEDAQPNVRIIANSEGKFELEKGFKYKIFKNDTTNNNWGLTLKINGINFNIDLPTYYENLYNYFYFQLVDLVVSSFNDTTYRITYIYRISSYILPQTESTSGIDNSETIKCMRYFTTASKSTTDVSKIKNVICEGASKVYKCNGNEDYNMGIPELPADASTKTYTLKAVNGVLVWVE